QHNKDSIQMGDNWIASIVSAVMSNPDWASTAIFITYDDCGCFYDHVPPPPGLGIRIPMVIVSPWARPGFTDSRVASVASILTFVEHQFGLEPLGPKDADAYDFRRSFDFTTPPRPAIRLRAHPISAAERRFLAEHPDDPDDPT